MGDPKDSEVHLFGKPDGETKQKPSFPLTKGQIAILSLGLCLLILFAPSHFHFGPDIAPNFLEVVGDTVGTVKWSLCQETDDIRGSECGYIIVPKDYFSPSAGTTKIALGRLKARSNATKGTILFNPGGPGGAGKPFITKRGYLLQEYIGNEYDLVGFDPRGIGESQPRTKCFDDNFGYNSFKRNTVLERSYEFAFNATTEEIRKELITQQREADSLLKTQFDVCRESMGDELRYMGTSTVVRDMDSIIKKLDGDDALINFYGGSYGSILGQYLVNMLPDRLGRVVIDGIADAVSWSEDPSYTWYRQWLSSTENTYNQFVDGCSQAGPDFCPLAKSKGEDPSEIKARIESFLNNLYFEPLSVPNATRPGVLTFGRARIYLLTALQRPITWPNNAYEIAQAINGDGSFILNAVEPNFYRDLERSAVSCNDNRPFTAPTPEEVVDELLHVYQNVSRFVFSVVTTEPDAGCQYWPVSPPERFQGPWNHTLSNPMLILSNTADPVTPIVSAQKVQDLLGDSARLLLQDGPGHVTLALPSFCTASHVQAYYSNGTLPPKGTICEVDVQPFPNASLKFRLKDVSDARARMMLVIPRLGAEMENARRGFRLTTSLLQIPEMARKYMQKPLPTHAHGKHFKQATHVEPTPYVGPPIPIHGPGRVGTCIRFTEPLVIDRSSLFAKLVCN